MVTFTEEIINGKLHFLCSVRFYLNKIFKKYNKHLKFTNLEIVAPKFFSCGGISCSFFLLKPFQKLHNPLWCVEVGWALEKGDGYQRRIQTFFRRTVFLTLLSW